MAKPGAPLSGFRREAGFSLLEVLVAFSILALSLGVLLQIFATGSRSAAATERYSGALTLAESKLAEAGRVSSDDIDATGESGGIYRWRVTSVPYDDPVFEDANLPIQAFVVTVAVSWEEGDRSPSLTMNSLRVLRKR